MRFTPEASRIISELPPDRKKLIKQVLVDIRRNPYKGKDLQEELFGFKSLRSKRYRIIYGLDEKEKLINVYHIGPRRDVYEQFRRLLLELQNSFPINKTE
jgi:mRNA-degrading endonuclease RelE of RelBE toxin-antitoxin system